MPTCCCLDRQEDTPALATLPRKVMPVALVFNPAVDTPKMQLGYAGGSRLEASPLHRVKHGIHRSVPCARPNEIPGERAFLRAGVGADASLCALRGRDPRFASNSRSSPYADTIRGECLRSWAPRWSVRINS
jgi:hypothetical protein